MVSHLTFCPLSYLLFHPWAHHLFVPLLHPYLWFVVIDDSTVILFIICVMLFCGLVSDCFCFLVAAVREMSNLTIIAV